MNIILRYLLIAYLLVAILPLTASEARANLLTNGDFGTGTFSGWSQTGNTSYTGITRSPTYNGNAYAAYFGQIGSDGYLSQTVATVPGTTYQISFWIQNGGGHPNDFGATVTGRRLGSNTLMSLTNANAFNYRQYIANFTAADGSTTLTFNMRQDPNYWYLDNVSLIQITQPSMSAPLAQYHMDEANWNGAPPQVLDSSGNGYNASNSPNNSNVQAGTSRNSAPAIPTNSSGYGTCGYGVFSNSYLTLPTGFPNLTSNFTITAWINTSNPAQSGQRIFEQDVNNSGGYGFSVGDGGTGNIRFFSRQINPIILDTPTHIIQANTWYFVTAVADITSKKTSIYVYNTAGNVLSHVSQHFTLNWGTDSGRIPSVASIGGEVNNACCGENSNRFRFAGDLDEVTVYPSALNPAQINQAFSLTHPCPMLTTAPGGFNAYDSGTPAGATTGYITTKIAGSAFSLDLIALNPTKTAISTTFTGTVRVDLLDSSGGGPVDSNGCNGAWPVIQTLAPGPTFIAANNGRLTAGFTENNAWPNARIRISYPATGTPTAIGCSGDNFAIRPYTFAVNVSDNNWNTPGTARTLNYTSASGGIVHKAGQPFTITASAYNAAGAVTSNYAGNPSTALIACVQPATGCAPGILLATNGSGGWSAAAGTVTSNSASYSDAGAFTMQLVDTGFANVDAADGSSPAQRTIASLPFNAGRFVPDHFDLATNTTPLFSTFNTTDSNCSSGSAPIRSFTYIGQAFSYLTSPQALIYARNASGVTTVNYSNALWHNPVPLASYANTGNANILDTSLTTSPIVSANNNGTGTATVDSTDLLAYTRNLNAPQNPFAADISLLMSVSDSSEAAVTGNGVINTATNAIFNGTGSGIGFDSGNLFRYGRLSLNNASGAETLNLPVPMQAQYWNGANFIVNTADNCTRLNANTIAMGNYTKNLAPCATALSLGTPLLNGIGNLKLLAPGANRNGSVDLTVNLQAAPPPAGSLTCLTTGTTQSPVTAAGLSYLQGKWSGTNYNVDPVVRATFGVYKNANEFIFMREMY